MNFSRKSNVELEEYKEIKGNLEKIPSFSEDVYQWQKQSNL